MGIEQPTEEKDIGAGPMSFVGSAQRIWKITATDNPGLKIALTVLALILIALAWVLVSCRYLIWGVLWLVLAYARASFRLWGKRYRRYKYEHDID